jgi:ATP-dependent helicase/nuclease subunit A
MGSDSSECPDEPTEENPVYEARLVANKIRELIDTAYIRDGDSGYRRVRFKDIAILMRAVRNIAPVFADELSLHGIPAFTEAGTGYFESYEIKVMTSLLKIIDNPMQDIPLLTVLMSPIFSFEADDAAIIRYAACPTTGCRATQMTLYECVETFAADQRQSDEALVVKAARFIETLNRWRDLATEMSISELIWYLMMSTDFYYHVKAMPGGTVRYANLKRLFEYAGQYETISYKGIFNFIRFIDKLIEGGGDFAGAKVAGEDEDTVRIMSIHKSKGLEFPIVFIVGAGRRFNIADITEQILLHRYYGFGPDFVDLKRRIRDNSLVKKIIRKKIRIETLSEEMRILYVAMTRAKERLFIVGTLSDAGKKMEKFGSHESALPQELAAGATSYRDWICSVCSLYAIETHAIPMQTDVDSAHGVQYQGKADAGNIPDVLQTGGASAAPISVRSEDADLQPEMKNEILERLTWEYPYKELTKAPLKVSVTQMGPKEARLEEAELGKPMFISGQKRFTGAQVGTFTHLVLEKVDFKTIKTARDVRNTIRSMIEKEMPLKEQADAVDVSKLMSFFGSKAGKMAVSAEKINKETAFTLRLSYDEYRALQETGKGAEALYNAPAGGQHVNAAPTLVGSDHANSDVDAPVNPDSEDFVLLQGIIDCWFETPDGIVILDYKTGRINGSDTERSVKEKYGLQMDLYSRALTKITGKPVSKRYVYLLFTGDCVEV